MDRAGREYFRPFFAQSSGGMNTVKRADIIGSLITVFFGIFAITQAVQIEYWWKFGPGPGFLPLWASIFLVFGGCLLLVQALRRPRLEKTVQKASQAPGHLLNIAAVAALMVLTSIAIIYLGFSISIFLFMALMVGVLGKYRWHVTLGTAAAVSLTFYLLFAKWLQVPLPKGFFGF